MIYRTFGGRGIVLATTSLFMAHTASAEFGYVAEIDTQGRAEGAETVSGVVFHDLSGDGVY